jgi:hypothetical protein
MAIFDLILSYIGMSENLLFKTIPSHFWMRMHPYTYLCPPARLSACLPVRAS